MRFVAPSIDLKSWKLVRADKATMNERLEGPAVINLTIVAGGTAGWLAASRLQKEGKRLDGPLSVALIASSKAATIGVGDGRTDNPDLPSGQVPNAGCRIDTFTLAAGRPVAHPAKAARDAATPDVPNRIWLKALSAMHS